MIKQLQLDGRKSFKELGEAIGYTGLGAKKRFKKLQVKNAVKISPLINAETLNIHMALILLEMENGEAVRNIVDRYRECPRVVNLFTTLGGFNLIALVMAEDQGTLESEAMEKCALRSGEGIRRSEFYPIGKIHYSPFLPLRQNIPSNKDETTPCGVNCRSCPSFQDELCLGCPSVSYYKGPLR